MNRAEAYAQQAKAKGEAENQVGQVRLADARDEGVGLLVDREVGDQEGERGQHRDTEQGCDLTLRATGSLLVEVRQTMHVRWQPGICETLR